MKQAAEMLIGLKYKRRIFGVEVMENETKSFGDNNVVIFNSLVSE